MYQNKLHNLSIAMFVLLGLLTAWLISEDGTWYKGFLFYFIMASYVGPKVIDRFHEQYNSWVSEEKLFKSLWVITKGWFLGVAYFIPFMLVLAFYINFMIYRSGLAPEIDFLTMLIILGLVNVCGMLIASAMLLPVICLFSILLYRKVKRVNLNMDKAHLKELNKFEQKQMEMIVKFREVRNENN